MCCNMSKSFNDAICSMVDNGYFGSNHYALKCNPKKRRFDKVSEKEVLNLFKKLCPLEDDVTFQDIVSALPSYHKIMSKVDHYETYVQVQKNIQNLDLLLLEFEPILDYNKSLYYNSRLIPGRLRDDLQLAINNDIFLGYYGIWKYENKMFIPVNRNNICLLMGIEYCNPGVIYDNVYSQRHKLTRANTIPEKVTQYYSDKRLLDVYRKDYDYVNELIDSFILK